MKGPAGFEPHYKRSPLTDPWEPIYSKREPTRVTIGLLVTAAHTNSRGFVHGGLIASLADNAMGLSCAQQRESGSGGVTLNLSVDYLSVAHLGDWMEFRIQFTKVGRSISVAECHVCVADRVIARANASFSHVLPQAPSTPKG